MADSLPDTEEGTLAFVDGMPATLKDAWDAMVPEASPESGVPYLE